MKIFKILKDFDMNKDEIKEMLSGQLATNDLHLLQTMRTEVGRLYACFGKHNSMTTVQLSQDVEMIAQALNREIKRDSSFANIRTSELVYLFGEVVKGTLASGAIAVISLRSVFGWIREYMGHEIRKAALSEYCHAIADARERVALPCRVMTEQDMWAWVNRSYADFVKWKEAPSVGNLFKKDSIPVCARDYGGCQTRFLQEAGLIHEGETLFSFFSDCYEFGMEKIEFYESED